MGLFRGEIRREFITRPDTAKQQILFKWPDANIRKLAQLTVEQDELAVFFRDGKVQGTISPGRVTLDSSEIPFLGALVDRFTGGDLFRTELYFVSTREFPDLPFGGALDNVVDPQTNLAIGLRVFGEYSLKVEEPESLILNLVGTQNLSTNEQITNWMREQLLKALRTDVVTHIVSNGWPLLGIAAHTAQVEQETLAAVQPFIQPYGLRVMRLGNFTIGIKDEDESRLKQYVQDVQYTRLAGGFQQYAAGEALLGAGKGLAQGPGAGGTNPAFLGVGLGLGGTIGGQAGQAVVGGGVVQVRCSRCNALNPESAKFCAQCGEALASAPAPPAASGAPGAPAGATVTCPRCGTASASGVKFCHNCGQDLQATGPAPPPPAPAG